MKTCKYLEDEVCCNDASEWLADFPNAEDCRRCKYFEGVKSAEQRVNRGSQCEQTNNT